MKKNLICLVLIVLCGFDTAFGQGAARHGRRARAAAQQAPKPIVAKKNVTFKDPIAEYQPIPARKPKRSKRGFVAQRRFELECAYKKATGQPLPPECTTADIAKGATAAAGAAIAAAAATYGTYRTGKYLWKRGRGSQPTNWQPLQPGGEAPAPVSPGKKEEVEGGNQGTVTVAVDLAGRKKDYTFNTKDLRAAGYKEGFGSWGGPTIRVWDVDVEDWLPLSGKEVEKLHEELYPSESSETSDFENEEIELEEERLVTREERQNLAETEKNEETPPGSPTFTDSSSSSRRKHPRRKGTLQDYQEKAQRRERASQGIFTGKPIEFGGKQYRLLSYNMSDKTLQLQRFDMQTRQKETINVPVKNPEKFEEVHGLDKDRLIRSFLAIKRPQAIQKGWEVLEKEGLSVEDFEFIEEE